MSANRMVFSAFFETTGLAIHTHQFRNFSRALQKLFLGEVNRRNDEEVAFGKLCVPRVLAELSNMGVGRTAKITGEIMIGSLMVTRIAERRSDRDVQPYEPDNSRRKFPPSQKRSPQSRALPMAPESASVGLMK